MLKTFSYLIYLFLKSINKLFYFFTNRNFITWVNYFINLDSEKLVTIKGKKVLFFIPNYLTEWRTRTFIDKEPDTIDWINNFKTKKKYNFLGYRRKYRSLLDLCFFSTWKKNSNFCF